MDKRVVGRGTEGHKKGGHESGVGVSCGTFGDDDERVTDEAVVIVVERSFAREEGEQIRVKNWGGGRFEFDP